MARVPLIDSQARPELSDLVSRVSGARGGRLINVYKLLLNSPPVASAWIDFNTAVRLESGIDPKIRELMIVRIAILARCEYVYRAHVPAYAKQAGLTDTQIEALWEGPNASAFDARERAAVAYAGSVTRDIDVPDAVFDALRPHFDERQIVELTVLAGAYNMQCRVLMALKADREPGWDLKAAHWR